MISKLAKVERLAPFADLAIIERFAVTFGLDPDFVYEQKDFDTVMIFTVKWKEQDEYHERYRQIDKSLNTTHENS